MLSVTEGMITIFLVVTAALVPATALDSKPRSLSHHDFSPRMDYDEWTPLGRGDPLKNDPTYDYMPPVLDRVHYWVDPQKRTPDLPIATSSIATNPPTTPSAATSRLGTINLLDPFLKLVDKTKSVIGLEHFHATQRPFYYTPPHHTHPSYVTLPEHNVEYVPPPPQKVFQKPQALQRPPYTMLMPPPPPSEDEGPTSTEAPPTSFGTSTRTTNDIEDSSPMTTVETSSEDNSTASTPTTSSTTVFANSENVYKPVAITMPEVMSNETGESTVGPATTTSDPLTLPIFNHFGETTNHLHDEETKKFMMPPPEDGYFGFLPTTVRTTTERRTTTVQAFTTDALFKHYKQPSKPARGPFYLIIQGHSKVKTYGANKKTLKPLSLNELNFEDSKSNSNYDDYESTRHKRKLKFEDWADEVILGRQNIEPTTFQSGFNSAFVVDENKASKTSKRSTESFEVYRRRKLLASTATTDKPEILDQELLNLESLIGLGEDYNSEDVLSLLLKQEGQGSGFGGFVSSLLGRSHSSSDEV